ncbi:amino acid adenylation domain-containing protein [Rhodobacterales bacterium HKCCE2091]|nr:amino acid adenylation domain-containing protein [Rhodobacterales bacterium HKCCE2091]
MTESAPDTRIAVIGRAGRFSGVRNVREFWRMLDEGRTGSVRLSTADLLAQGVSRKALADPAYVPVAHPLPDMECFDAGFWGFSPREAQILDPQHRHFLETAWEALEDAGRMPEDFDGRVGVYAGSGMQAYLPFNLLTNPDLVEEIGLFLLRHTGNDKDFLTTRLSYLLNLTGPSVAVQTACSTSLVAVHEAVNALLNMECEMALAGGVTIELPHHVGYRYAEGEILSPDGLCRAFDDGSQGTVFGSGAGIVVLRRYEDAVADGDDIKAVILGSAINNDGAGKASYLAPSVDGQAEAAAEAVALAGVDPGSISYIEAHGTGTPIGDPIELSALGQVYGEAGQGAIGIGSVKTNIGHLDTAAGAASLIKVIEAMRHKRLPASLHFEKPNSRYDWQSGPFEVVASGRDWTPAGPRRAAINSLGVGGTNAHVVVEEAPMPAASAEDGQWRLYPFSAHSAAAVDGIAGQWAGFLDDPDAPGPADIAFTLRHGRRVFPERMAIAADSREALDAALAARVSGVKRRGTAAASKPRVVFLFPGGGAQYPGAGAEMLAAEPVFAAAVDACFAALPADAPADLREMMFDRDLDDAEARGKLGRSGYAIPALFILEYAYAKLWDHWGVAPDAILAHSVGEYAGAVVAGALPLADALKVVTLRGKVMDAAPEGAMTTVPLPADEARGWLGDTLDIAAINSATTTVVSGQVSDIEALEVRLAAEGHEARRIHIDVAAHSRQLEGQLETFRKGFEGVAFGSVKVPMVSSLRGGWGEAGDFTSADYWVRHLRNTVRFTDAVAAALSEPDTVVIEVGPGQTLGPLVEAAEVPHPARAILPSAPRPRDTDPEPGVALAAAGGLWAEGWPLDFDRLPGAGGGRRVSLPTYAFEKTRHWIAPGKGATAEVAEDLPLVLDRTPDMANWVEALGWRDGSSLPAPNLAGTDWLVFAGDDELSAAVLSALGAARRVVTVRRGEGFALDGDAATLRPDVADDYEALFDALGTPPAHILMLWGLGDPAAFGAGYCLARAMQIADCGGRLTLATTGSVSLAGEPAEHPEGRALLGLVRVAPREVPGLTATLVDLPADPALAPALLAEAAGDGGADHVALRPGARHLRDRHAAPAGLPEGLPARLREGGVYLLTGGTGGIGRQLALWLAGTASAKVALLSRSATEDSVLASEIAAAGGEVMSVAADVTDRDSLAAAIEAVKARFGPVNGVIHGAGMIDDRPLSAKTLDEARALMAPKLDGARLLDELFPAGTLDVFAVISSSSVVIGGAGQADYAGANAALEAIAEARPDGFSIAWGVWRDTGMAARAYGAGETGAAALPGDRVEAGGGVVEFHSLLDPDTDWRLIEHVVGGAPVLPGTAYVDLALAVAAALYPDRDTELRDLGFEQPMIFADGLPRRVIARAEPAGEGCDLTILSRVGPEDPAEHVRLHIGPASVGAPEGALSAPVGTVLDAGGHAAQEDLIAFGPRWNNIGELRGSGIAAEGDFALDPAFAAEVAEHPAHPALLDMAWTVGLHLLPEADRAGKVYVPMSLAAARFSAPLPASLTARAVIVAQEPGRFVAFDVVLIAPDGAEVAMIERFSLRAVPGGDLAPMAETPPLTAQLLSTGIKRTEAAELFARVFAHPDRALVVSPVSLDLVRLAMEEVPKRAEASAAAGSGAAIADPVAAKLAGIWQDILGVTGIGPDDEFFALGGHSLNAVRMFGRVKKDMGMSVPIATLFEAPSLSALAAFLRDHGATAGDAPEAAASAPAPARTAAAPRRRDPLTIEMTEGQREIAAVMLVDPEGSVAYNLSVSLHLDGALDETALVSALRAVLARHDALRATVDLQALEVTIWPERTLAIETRDLRGLDAAAQDTARQSVLEGIAGKVMNLEEGPVLRAVLLKQADDRNELMLFVNHILCDGWSLGVIVGDLARLYEAETKGTAADLPPPASIVDLVAAERDWLATPDAARHRDYWVGQFAAGVPEMEVPTDRPRPRVKTTNSRRVTQRLGAEEERRLRALADRIGISPRSLLFTLLHLYLGRITGLDDVVMGLPSSGQVSHGLDNAVAHGVNFLPFRARLDREADFAAHADRLRHALGEALDHQNYTYGALMRDLRLARDASRVAIVPIAVNIDNLADSGTTFADLGLEIDVNPTGHHHFEMFINIFEMPGRVELAWNYNSDLYDEATIAAHAAGLASMLDRVDAAPDITVGTLLAADAATRAIPASGSFDDPGAAGPQTITEVFRAVALRHPDRVALRFGDAAMDYATLDARSDALAGWLASLGVGPGDLVGITSERSLSLIVAVMAVLKAGAGYVPFDTALPDERLAFIAEDTGIRILLGSLPVVEAAGVTAIPHADFPETGTAPAAEVTGASIAYVMFTSGTTGKPKGVMLPHRSVIRMLVDTDWVDLGPDTVTLHSSAFAFDTSIIDIFGALLHGGTVVVPPAGQLSIADLSDAIESHGVNTLWLTSGLFHAVADMRPRAFARVRQVIVGGDVVSPSHVAKVMKTCPGVTVINGYGPTESNVTNAYRITAADLDSGRALPIGPAIPGTQIFILGQDGWPVPTGVQGELAIAGRGLALGYWNRPELTAAKFIRAPWDPDLTLYRSGDLALNPGDGVIRFLGRIDTQVKIRGFRVELGEIEAVLEAHPGVRQATVTAVVPDGQLDRVLSAYVVAESNVRITTDELKAHARNHLPDFARPAFVTLMDALPLNANGKVDRRQLPAPVVEFGRGSQPETEAERRIAAIWRQILGLESVGAEDNFFALGGHSLLAVRLFDRIRKEFGQDLPISTLFANQTVRDLAGVVGDRFTVIEGKDMETEPDEDWDTTTVIHPGPGGPRARPALFVVGGVGGNVNNLFQLGQQIGRDRALIGFQTRGVMGHAPHETIEEMAAENIRYMRAHQSTGPYLIAGYSGGALTAHEMVRQLEANGESVSRLVVLDTYAPGFATDFVPNVRLGPGRRIAQEVRLLRTKGVGHLVTRTKATLRDRLVRARFLWLLRRISPLMYRFEVMKKVWRTAALRYEGGPITAPVTLFKADPSGAVHKAAFETDPSLGWSALVPEGRFEIVMIGGDHQSMLEGEHVVHLAELIAEALGRDEEPPARTAPQPPRLVHSRG